MFKKLCRDSSCNMCIHSHTHKHMQISLLMQTVALYMLYPVVETNEVTVV